MSALRLINETEITSTVSSIDIENVFSENFRNYLIVLDGVQESSSGNHQWVRLRYINSSGSVVTSSNYSYAQRRIKNDDTAFAEERGTNQDNLLYSGTGYTDDDGTNSSLYVLDPFLSSYTFSIGQGTYLTGTVAGGFKGFGIFKDNISMTGFRLYQSSGNLGSGFIRTYGFRVVD